MKTPKNRNTLSETQVDHLTCLFQGNYTLIVEAVCRHAPVPGLLEDVVQQAYIAFIQGIAENKWDSETWNHAEDVGPLLYVIAKRTAQAMWRKHIRNQRHSSIDLVAGNLIGSYETDEAESTNDKKAKMERLKHCLERLPSGSRAIVEQHYFGGVAMKELARQYEKSDSAIYNFFFNVRAKLRDCVEKGLKQGK